MQLSRNLQTTQLFASRYLDQLLASRHLCNSVICMLNLGFLFFIVLQAMFVFFGLQSIKKIIGFGFCFTNCLIKQFSAGKSYQPRLRFNTFITLTSTLIVLYISKTSSNNFLLYLYELQLVNDLEFLAELGISCKYQKLFYEVNFLSICSKRDCLKS